MQLFIKCAGAGARRFPLTATTLHFEKFVSFWPLVLPNLAFFFFFVSADALLSLHASRQTFFGLYYLGDLQPFIYERLVCSLET